MAEQKNMPRGSSAAASGNKSMKQSDEETGREGQQQRSSRGAAASGRESRGQKEGEFNLDLEDDDPVKNPFEDEEDLEEKQEHQEEE